VTKDAGALAIPAAAEGAAFDGELLHRPPALLGD
jgi:hypothetical protein